MTESLLDELDSLGVYWLIGRDPYRNEPVECEICNCYPHAILTSGNTWQEAVQKALTRFKEGNFKAITKEEHHQQELCMNFRCNHTNDDPCLR